MKIKIKKLHQNAKMPSNGTAGSAGFDLHTTKNTVLHKGKPTKIPTGLAFEIPEGYVGVVYSRSSSAKNGIMITPLLVDSDYRGEVFVLANYFGDSDDPRANDKMFILNVGDRIAQIRIEKLVDTEYKWAEELNETARGSGGFGSTGR